MTARASPRHAPGRHRSRRGRRPTHYWVHTVTTVSTAPPARLFTRDAATIARVLASRRVSPKGRVAEQRQAHALRQLGRPRQGP